MQGYFPESVYLTSSDLFVCESGALSYVNSLLFLHKLLFAKSLSQSGYDQAASLIA